MSRGERESAPHLASHSSCSGTVTVAPPSLSKQQQMNASPSAAVINVHNVKPCGAPRLIHLNCRAGAVFPPPPHGGPTCSPWFPWRPGCCRASLLTPLRLDGDGGGAIKVMKRPLPPPSPRPPTITFLLFLSVSFSPPFYVFIVASPTPLLHGMLGGLRNHGPDVAAPGPRRGSVPARGDAFRLPGVVTSASARRPISAKLLQFATSRLFFPHRHVLPRAFQNGGGGGAGKSLQTLLEG